jgi:His-Xaa-Ser system radical SAM maturase HxsB
MILPFNFDRLSSGNYVISNEAGFYSKLSKLQLSELVNFGKTGNIELNQQLQSKLFLQEDKYADASIASLASASAKKISNELTFNPIFMIVPTLRCDHTCKYCQVSRASVSAKGYDLPEESIPQIISAIKKLSSPPYKIEIQGGEPLLRFDLVQIIYSNCLTILGDDFEFIIATSLSLFDEKVLDWSKDKNVSFSTSLDGDQIVHNHNRILKKGDSYGKVINAIKVIKSELGDGKISTVTTVTKQALAHPKKLLQAHKEVSIFDLFVRPISPYGFVNKNSFDEYTISEYMSFYQSLLREIENENSNGTCFVEHSAAIHVKRLHLSGFNSYADLKSPGGIFLNCILFNYDGRIYGSDESRMLQKAHPTLDFSIGSFNRDSVNIKMNDFSKSAITHGFNQFHPGCNTCAYQPFCGVDPCHHISSQGEPIGDKSLSFFCNYHKSTFRLILDEITKNSNLGLMLESWADV